MNKLLFIITGLCMYQMVWAQSNSTDTVIVQLAKTSQLTLTIGDPGDLRLLQHYDFEALFEDMLSRLAESNDIDLAEEVEDDPEADEDFEYEEEDDEDYEDEEEDEEEEDDEEDEDDEDEEDDENDEYEYNGDMDDDDDDGKWRNTKNRIFGLANIDFGIGNYHSDLSDSGDEQYTVRPWGSWYIALNSLYHTHINDDFQIDWGVGVSWYNFKFQDDRTVLNEEASQVVFSRDERDLEFIKSKLTVSYINASIVPVFEFGRHRDHNGVLKNHNRDFRIGAGVYGGYRIGSYTKQVYEEDDERERERVRDNYYLSNIRYGVRLQLGIHNTDFFFNYDLNDLFADNHGPKLNAYSFGILF